MRERHPVAVVGLSLLTFTVYAYYWLYKTTDELREEMGRDDLLPLVDVLLTVMTFGLWGIWAMYRNAKIVHEELIERGESHADTSAAVGLFGGLTYFSGLAWLVAIALLQQDYNLLAESAHGEASRPPVFDFSPSIPVAPRVDAAPRSADRSSPAGFATNAPAPHVF